MIEAEPSSPELWVCHLGTIHYRDALALQLDIRARRQAEELPDTLLLLEHPPVYTRGRRSADDELSAHDLDSRAGESSDRAHGIDVIETDRGGRVTYHGPGQLVGYPIMRVPDIGAHLRTLEAAVVDALGDYGIEARSRRAEGPDYTGVWVEDRKIASIGVHVSRGVSTHGFAVNVTNDLEPFSWVIACGLPDVTMTSLARELPAGRTLDPDAFRTCTARRFCEAHHRRPRIVSRHALMRGRTPRANALRTPAARADAAQTDPTLDTAPLVTGHGAPV